MSWKKGESGNLSGRKRSNWRKHFDAAIEADTAKYKQSLFEYAIEQSRQDNTLLAAILRKCLPDMKSVENESTGDGPIRLMIALPGAVQPGAKQIGGSQTEPGALPEPHSTEQAEQTKPDSEEQEKNEN